MGELKRLPRPGVGDVDNLDRVPLKPGDAGIGDPLVSVDYPPVFPYDGERPRVLIEGCVTEKTKAPS